MLKSRLALIAVVSQIVFTSMLSAQDDSQWLIPRAMVASTELKIVWQYNLPMAKGESLNDMLLYGNRLCTLSSGNYLSCINKADGNVMFASLIAPAGLPVVDLESYKGELLAMVGNKLVEINADFGTEKTKTQIDTGVAAFKSTLSKPTPARPITFNLLAASIKSLLALVALRTIRAS